MESSYWYKSSVFYEIFVRAFYDSSGDGHGDLKGLEIKLDYLKELGVDCLWLNPIYPSPLKDGGYDISDFCNIHPDYGNLEDLKSLVKAAHQHGLRIITDLVLNHTSDQHPWFQAARMDRNSPYRDYYVWSDSGKEYSDARIIFLDTETSNWTWDPVAGQYFWHRFYSFQPDLNYDNPLVHAEIERVIQFWLDLGVDGFRCDAVPYLYERDGTNCENLPETHDFLKKIRHYIDRNYPGRVILCEANQWPKDVRAYFGNGDEFQLAFQFPLMPRIFMALGQHNGSPIRWILENTPVIPPNSQWCIFLRNHDELTLEMVSDEERLWMWEHYAPDPRMRLNLGIRRRLAPLMDNDQRLIELANSLLFSLPGSPVLYYGDEIGMGDNIWLPDRDGLRTPMQWDASTSAGFSSSVNLFAPVIQTEPYSPQMVNLEAQKNDLGSLWSRIQKMIAIRKEIPALNSGDFRWLDCHNSKVFSYYRHSDQEQILCIHNLSPEPQQFNIQLSNEKEGMIDQLSEQKFAVQGKLMEIELEPYQYLWLF
jgi:maltose alpha-D-glucosyltransferase / alpha-amylase